MTLQHTFTLSLASGVPLDLVYVPASEFLMGSDRAIDTKATDHELPQQGIRAAYRLPNPPISRNDILGFRVATPSLLSSHEQ